MMLPDTDSYEEDEETSDDLEEEKIPDDTYQLDFNTMSIHGRACNDEAKKQAILKRLCTEGEEYAIYEASYGMVCTDLIGTPMNYALSECEDRIEESLLQDDRFASVKFTDRQVAGRTASISFTVICSDGTDIEIEGVNINV